MNKEIILIILIIIGISYYIDDIYANQEVAIVQSRIDGRNYVVRNLPDKQQAADLLAQINQNNIKLIEHLKVKFPDDERVLRLQKNYSPDSLSEGTEDNKYTSYSVNKGEKIVCCLRGKPNNELIDLNTLSYVLNHELCHLATKSINHTKEFWDNFKWLLNEAVKAGIYQIEDYSKVPKTYCGLSITSNILIESK